MANPRVTAEKKMIRQEATATKLLDEGYWCATKKPLWDTGAITAWEIPYRLGPAMGNVAVDKEVLKDDSSNDIGVWIPLWVFVLASAVNGKAYSFFDGPTPTKSEMRDRYEQLKDDPKGQLALMTEFFITHRIDRVPGGAFHHAYHMQLDCIKRELENTE